MKNKVLWSMTNINVLSFIVMAIALDTDSWIPFIVMCVNLAWCALFAVINIDYFDRKADRWVQKNSLKRE